MGFVRFLSDVMPSGERDDVVQNQKIFHHETISQRGKSWVSGTYCNDQSIAAFLSQQSGLWLLETHQTSIVLPFVQVRGWQTHSWENGIHSYLKHYLVVLLFLFQSFLKGEPGRVHSRFPSLWCCSFFFLHVLTCVTNMWTSIAAISAITIFRDEVAWLPIKEAAMMLLQLIAMFIAAASPSRTNSWE